MQKRNLKTFKRGIQGSNIVNTNLFRKKYSVSITIKLLFDTFFAKLFFKKAIKKEQIKIPRKKKISRFSFTFPVFFAMIRKTKKKRRNLL